MSDAHGGVDGLRQADACDAHYSGSGAIPRLPVRMLRGFRAGQTDAIPDPDRTPVNPGLLSPVESDATRGGPFPRRDRVLQRLSEQLARRR